MEEINEASFYFLNGYDHSISGTLVQETKMSSWAFSVVLEPAVRGALGKLV